MPAFGPLSRRELIAGLRALGWTGPFIGRGKPPEFMVNGPRQVKLPNPHRGDIRAPLLKRILDEADITREEWEQV